MSNTIITTVIFFICLILDIHVYKCYKTLLNTKHCWKQFWIQSCIQNKQVILVKSSHFRILNNKCFICVFIFLIRYEYEHLLCLDYWKWPTTDEINKYMHCASAITSDRHACDLHCRNITSNHCCWSKNDYSESV